MRTLIFIPILLIAIIALYYSHKKTLYGCCFLLISRILIPECVRMTPLIDISLNTMMIIIIGFFTLRDIINRNVEISVIKNDIYLKQIILFTFAFFVILQFSNYENYSYQIARLTQFIITDFFPVTLFIINIRTKKDLTLIIKVLFIVSLISCIWGIMTLFLGKNTYVFELNSLYSHRDYLFEENSLDTSRGIAGTSGTFEHANGWGYFLPITFVLFFFLYDITKNKKIPLLLILLSVSVFICSKRSAIIAYSSFWMVHVFFIDKKKKIRYLIGSLCFLFAIYIIVNINPNFEKVKGLLESSLYFWNDNVARTNSINGSNFNMRITQVIYSFTEVKDNIIFGKGFGWTSYYLSKNAYHPILYGFETIISDAIVNGGIVGLCLWIYIFISSYRYSAIHDKNKYYYKLFTFVQIVIAIATGLSYFIFYGIYIVILNKLYLLKNDKNINSNRHIQLRKRH